MACLRAFRNLNTTDWLFVAYLVVTAGLILGWREQIPEWQALLLLHAAGIFFIAGLTALSRRWQLINFLHDWYPLLAPILTFNEVALLSRIVLPGWRDSVLLRFEEKLFRVPPTAWLGQHASWGLTEILELGYFSYYVLLMIVGGVLYTRTDRKPFRGLMAATVLAYMFCYAIFILFPTQGPAHTLAAMHTQPLPGGPFHWLVAYIQGHAGVHGNAFPSAHVAAAMVALLYAWRYAPKLGLALTPFVALLSVGAVYDRYHYVSDIAVGILLGLAAVALSWKFCTVFTR
jgi:membrane-associated phospholipid phosphatase